METTPEPRAYYHPARDLIHMPSIATFHTGQGHYETLGHEAVHWTGGTAPLDRIGRCKDGAACGSEELVAWMEQCAPFATFSLTPSPDERTSWRAGQLDSTTCAHSG